MKVQSGLRFAATALLVSTAGFVIAQSGSHLNAAFAESALTPANLIAQNTTDKKTDGKGRWQERKDKMFQDLNLTPEQQAKIKAIREQDRSSSQSLRDQMKAAWEKMRSLSAGNASDAELRQQHRELQRLAQQASDRRFETMLKIRAELTPEQRTKMAEMKGKGRHGGRHHGPRAHGGQMMMGGGF